MSAKKPSYQKLSDENSRLKKHIREIEKRFHSLVESTPDIIVNIDSGGTILSANKSLAGFTVKALTGMNIFELIPVEERSVIAGIKEQAFKSESPGVCEYHTINGRSYSVTINPVKKRNKVQGAALIMRDISGYKRAEEALRFEKNFAENLLETAQFIVLILDTRGRIIRYNRYMEEISGYKLDEVAGKNWFTIFLPRREQKRIKQVFETAIGGSHTHGNINAIVTKDGQERIIEWYDNTLKDNKGLLIGIIAIGHDITERSKAEEALRTSEAQLSNAMHIAQLGYWEYNVATDLFTFNDHFYNIFHTSAEAMGGYKMSSARYAQIFVHPDDLSVVSVETRKAIETTDPDYSAQLEHRMVYANGEVGYIAVRIFILKDNQGRTIKTYGANQDITEQKKAEQALRISESQLSNAMQVANLGYWEYDVALNLFIFNDHFYNIFHTTAEKMNGYTMVPEEYAEIFVHPEDKDVVTLELKKSIETDDPDYSRNLIHRILYANGDEGYMAVWLYILKDKHGRTVKTYGVNQDITDRIKAAKALEEQNKKYLVVNEKLKKSLEKVRKMNKELKVAKIKAEESDKLKSAFLANMSHEIRTPMNGIIGFGKMLRKKDLADEKRERYLGIIDDLCMQLLRLIDDIIDISKIEIGQIEIRSDATNVNRILNNIFTFYTPAVKKKNIEILLKDMLPDEESEVSTDAVKLRQILDNLIGNAIKFTEKGSIKFGYHLKAGFLEFFIKDSGIGIHSEYQEKIFERFIQAEDSTTRAYGGAGLGLAISRAYVEKLGGKIWVKSQPEEGSEFYFTIPYHPVKYLIQEDIPGQFFLRRQKPVILIVEDEKINSLFFKELFSEYNIKLLFAYSGGEAVAFCIKHPEIDLVLMDLKLPDYSGYEATKKILTIRKDLPIIAQTAYAMPGDKEKAFEVGCADYITKPIDDKILMSMIRSFLNKKQTQNS